MVDVGYPLLVTRVPALASSGLRTLADVARQRMGGGAVVFATTDTETGKVLLIAAGSDEAVATGFHDGNVIKAMSAVVGGRGGGKPSMAQGGGEDVSAIDEALRVARAALNAG